MAIEQTINNLDLIYQDYNQLLDDINNRIMALPEGEEQDNLAYFNGEFLKFDVKLRLGLAVEDIRLNEMYAREKMGDLKECHLMLYKLTDIWFSYEAYFRVHKVVFNVNLSHRKIIWLEDNTNIEYFNNPYVALSLLEANEELSNSFNTEEKRKALKFYLNYCAEEAEGGQKNRIQQVADNILPQNALQNYNHTEILSMTYAIRNNFVHNGEITIYPENFHYGIKNEYLKILYKYLVVVTMVAASITIQERLTKLF